MKITTDYNAVVDLTQVADELLTEAGAKSGRAAHTLTPGAGAPLKQTMLALTAGTVLAEHESPGAATLHVLRGDVRLLAGDDDVALGAGSYTSIPPTRHSVSATSDAVMLITVSQPTPAEGSPSPGQ